MYPSIDPPAETGRRVAIASIAASAVLATLNVGVGLLTRSTSVVATGVEFAGDVLASSVVLVGMIVAARPADENHPYGHGRIETLAAFLVGVILAVGGVGICWNSLKAIGETHAPPASGAIAVLVLAIEPVVELPVRRRTGRDQCHHTPALAQMIGGLARHRLDEGSVAVATATPSSSPPAIARQPTSVTVHVRPGGTYVFTAVWDSDHVYLRPTTLSPAEMAKSGL